MMALGVRQINKAVRSLIASQSFQMEGDFVVFPWE